MFNTVIRVNLSLQISPNKQPRKLLWRSFLTRCCNSRNIACKTSQRWDMRCNGKRNEAQMRSRPEGIGTGTEKGEQKKKSQWEERDIRTTRLFIFGLINYWSRSKDTALFCPFGMFWLRFASALLYYDCYFRVAIFIGIVAMHTLTHSGLILFSTLETLRMF